MIGRRALLSGAAAASLAKPAFAGTNWRIVTEYPATAMPGEGIAFFAETVNARSGGALTIRPAYDAPDGLRSADMIGAVADGRVDAADAFTGALAATSPIFQLSSLPFLTTSIDDTVRLARAAVSAYVRALAAHGLTLLYATPWPATGLWSRTALATEDALKGLRVRTYDAAGTAVFRAAGADPTQLSFADAMPRLRAGDLDAVLSSGDGGAGARLWEVLPHFTALDYAFPLSLAFANTRAADNLPFEGLAALWSAAETTEAHQYEAIKTRTANNYERMRANGVTIAS